MGTNLNDFLPMVDKLVSIHKEKVPAYEKVITDLTSQVLILDESKKGAEKHASQAKEREQTAWDQVIALQQEVVMLGTEINSLRQLEERLSQNNADLAERLTESVELVQFMDQ